MTNIETLKERALQAWQLASDNYGNMELHRKWEEACDRLSDAESEEFLKGEDDGRGHIDDHVPAQILNTIT